MRKGSTGVLPSRRCSSLIEHALCNCCGGRHPLWLYCCLAPWSLQSPGTAPGGHINQQDPKSSHFSGGPWTTRAERTTFRLKNSARESGVVAYGTQSVIFPLLAVPYLYLDRFRVETRFGGKSEFRCNFSVAYQFRSSAFVRRFPERHTWVSTAMIASK